MKKINLWMNKPILFEFQKMQAIWLIIDIVINNFNKSSLSID